LATGGLAIIHKEDLAKFGYRWSGNHPQEDLAKFGYRWSGNHPQEDLAKFGYWSKESRKI
jgi:hypothetical protein